MYQLISPNQPPIEVAHGIQVLTGMTPSQVIGLFRQHGRAPGIDGALDYLPTYAPEHGRAVYAAFAESETEEDRDFILDSLPSFVGQDYEYGMRLWGQLIRDPSPVIRAAAYKLLEEYLVAADEVVEIDDVTVNHSPDITWRDACNLLHSYIEAERGVNIHCLGATALAGSGAIHQQLE